MALLISESGEKTRIVPDEGTKSFSLKQMQDYVGGGLIQKVPTYDAKVAAWCNEEGLIKRMEGNAAASMYLTTISGIPQSIVGPVVIFEEGDTDTEWSWMGIQAQMEEPSDAD
jgi:hypothetical protein